jgi:hexosaminidase
MLQRLKGRTGLFIKQFAVTHQNYDSPGSLRITVNRPGVIKNNENESYTLVIKSGDIQLNAETDLGAMHGLETLLQLIQNKNGSYFFPGCIINDSPRFPWRGLLIDVGRHFIPVDVIKRNLDGMAAVKLNVLHLHLTEDQGFRIESKTFPELHQLGSDGLFYSQDQIKDIIEYAADRGIRVIPEFDMPGHATSWLVSHPEIASGQGPYLIERGFGVFNPTMNPTIDTTYRFLDKFIAEMAQLFPDEYFNIGGDENNGKEWNSNSAIQSYKKEKSIPDNPHLQAYFNQHMLEILTHYGKKMMGWDEIMQPTLPKNIVIQSWRGKQGLLEAARAGFPVVLSNGYYIDLMQPADEHYLNDPSPSAIPLTDDQKKLILGGEATMWSEMVTWETIDSRIWPRTAAIAERLWSPVTVINIPVMYEKLDFISLQLEELGLTHEKNYDMMLRRLVGGYDISPLKTLVDVLEPVKNYDRVDSREVNYTTGSPFTRVVDAARPDARVARKFNTLVEHYLLDPRNSAYANELKQYFGLWIANHELLKKTIQNSPVLNEIEPLSSNLAIISKIGLEILAPAGKTNKLSPKWKEESLLKIKQARVPHGQAELMVVKGIEQLVTNVKQ